jgi:shikimate kinase
VNEQPERPGRPAPPTTDGPRRGVVVIGFMGAGKSVVGRLLAGRLDVTFSDTDGLIEARHGAIAELFATRGEAAFRALEREVVLAEVSRAERNEAVVSLGGGAVTDGDVPPRVLFARATGSERPLARDEASFTALYERRRPLYEACATVRLVNDGRRTPGELAAELARRVAGCAA